jgi:hypothetical protein
MALIDLWKRSREELAGKRLAQIIGLAGSGKLKDDNDASQEFRHLLSNVPTNLLVEYADQCLTDKFDDSGLALQDIVNQLGKRLGFSTTEGRYRGTTSQIGFDGIWRSPQGHSLIVEVKTTDAYRIDLNVIAGYRRALISDARLSEEGSSMLIVVGRQDTGDLEAQIRGSKHAWDVRLISLDALGRLVKLKEALEDPSTINKVYDVLVPREFTRVDGIIDLVFSTAEESREDAEPQVDDDNQRPKFIPASFHEACVNRLQTHFGVDLIRQSKATFLNPDESLVVVCTVSREHALARGSFYWFAFHPHQRDTLSRAGKAYVAFGCGSEATIVLVPFAEFDTWLGSLNITKKPDRMYWHVHIRRDKHGIFLDRKKGFERIDLKRFVLPEGP